MEWYGRGRDVKRTIYRRIRMDFFFFNLVTGGGRF